MCFGGQRADTAIARELMRVVQPIAIQAALVAERTHMETQREQQRILELELQQARYEASLAERRYAACDPDNRLIAAQLEKNWETSLRRVSEYEARLDDIKTHNSATCRRSRCSLVIVQRDDANAPAVGARAYKRHYRQH